MNWNQLEGDWKQFRGKVREQMVGRIQERYGITQEQAERDVDTFVRDFDAVRR